MNEENLKPFKKGEQRQKDLGKMGGIKSGEAKREKKLFKEAIEKQLGKSIDDIIASYILKASEGDVQAGVFLRDTIGEKPTDKVEADLNTDVTINIELTDKE